jgi:hypothetical protein
VQFTAQFGEIDKQRSRTSITMMLLSSLSDLQSHPIATFSVESYKTYPYEESMPVKFRECTSLRSCAWCGTSRTRAELLESPVLQVLSPLHSTVSVAASPFRSRHAGQPRMWLTYPQGLSDRLRLRCGTESMTQT